jgi:hypothetical protein
VQTPDYVMILHEMMHDARVTPLDAGHTFRRPSSSGKVILAVAGTVAHGSSTTNFTDRTSFSGSGQALHVIERFTRVDSNTLRYEFTIDDPVSFTSPWSAVSSMSRTEGPILEYACHEGNYSLLNTLRGARFAEKNR